MRNMNPAHPSGGPSCRVSRDLILLMFVALAVFLCCRPVGAKAAPLDRKTQTAVIDSLCAALGETYVFPDVAKEMEKLIRKNLKEGTYAALDNLSDSAGRLTADLQSVSHDKHLRVVPLPPRGPDDETKLSPEERQKQQAEQQRYENFGFKKVELLPGNIGYIDFRYFAEAEDAGRTAIAAMNFLANADALIFDLRQNGGGSPSMIQLLSSYLFEEPVHLNSFYIRKSGETKQFWTQTWVDGPRMADTPVYVLTSNATFSGAEEFTYNLKNMKRGTIIGETTGGGAHPVEYNIVESLGIAFSVPFGRAVNPITGTNWEGTGIEPDIKVPADQALSTARIEAMKKLMEREQNALKKSRLTWVLRGLEAEKNPVTLDERTLQSYAGTYGSRKVRLEGGALYYQREGRPEYKLLPMGDDTFMIKETDYFRVKFNRNASGDVVEFVGMYDNGTTDSNKRDAR